MKEKINDPFLCGKPVLDLHGETYESSKIITKLFIEDAVRLGEKTLVIIHGKGKGIVKQSVYEELKMNKYVSSYKTDNFNDGMTIVNLK